MEDRNINVYIFIYLFIYLFINLGEENYLARPLCSQRSICHSLS